MPDRDDDIDVDELFGGPLAEAPTSAPPPAPAPVAVSDDDFDLSGITFGESAAQTSAPLPPTAAPLPPPAADASDDDENPMEAMGLKQEAREGGIGDLRKPWMKFHRFILVKTIEQVREVVDMALEHGRCALDLETEGFDNRIDYDEQGKPYTRHKIVSYCISVRGVGHYLPIRHEYDTVYGQKDPNLPIDETNAEIRRLCLASQPVLTEEGRAKDPYASLEIEQPGKVVIYFWNAKFDQEFLMPITGLYFWHPESFEDGLLSAYVVYSDDKTLGLKAKASQRLHVTDPETGTEYPYEMINFDELFVKGTPKGERKIKLTYPEDGSNVTLYGCSDGICTELLCEVRKTNWAHTVKDLKYRYDEVVTPARHPRFASILRLEKQTVMGVREMERNRTKVAKTEISALLKEAEIERSEYLERIRTLASGKGFEEFNPGSPKQLSDFLFSERGLDIKPKPDKNEKSQLYKTDAATLESFVEADPDAPEVLRQIVKYRQIDKVIGTYLTSLAENTDENDCLRFNFRQTGAATGRFTAPQGEPEHGFAGVPIHGIPARVDAKRPKVANSLRRLFVPHDGYTMVKIDYAGQELRVVTNISGEPLWRKEFLEGSGDLHTLTARAFFGPHITKANTVERQAGKIANFSLIYGGGVQAIQRATKCDKVEAARKKSAFDKSVPVFAEWVKKQHAFVKKNGGVFTGFNRFIAIPDANIRVGELDSNGKAVTDEMTVRRIRAGCERKSTNYPIQGSGADILKISMVKLVKELHRRGWLRHDGDDSVRMLMTVHDEIVYEIRHERLMEAMPVIVEIMESPSRMRSWVVPLIVEPLIGKSWGDKYEWEDIMKGKTPVPDWLQGHVQPKPDWRLVPGDNTTQLPALKAEAAPRPAESPRGELPIPAINVSAPKPSQMAVFCIPNSLLTPYSKKLVMQAIDGAIFMGTETDVQRFKRLQVMDGQGHIIIPLNLRIRIDPEELSRNFRERGLGPGKYDLVDEPS
jgi:DNA polymerase I-like protein with 3'-5' exonuclease and polymerase domains